MDSVVKRQLDECMRREWKDLVAVGGEGPIHSVIFRRNTDKNSVTNHLTIFYSANEGISVGDELTFWPGDTDTVFLVLNCENIESTDFRRSDVIRCNSFADFCYAEIGYDQLHNRVEVCKPYDTNVPSYVSSGMNSAVQTRTADDLQILCSGRHGMTVGNIITIKKMAENKDHTYKPGIAYFEASAVDNSNLIISPVDNTGGGLITILARTSSKTYG